MQMGIDPTAGPVLPDCIAKNFSIQHINKFTAILMSGRRQNYTQVQRIYSALKQKCPACLYRATQTVFTGKQETLNMLPPPSLLKYVGREQVQVYRLVAKVVTHHYGRRKRNGACFGPVDTIGRKTDYFKIPVFFFLRKEIRLLGEKKGAQYYFPSQEGNGL